LGDWLQCTRCFSKYPIENGIPVLLAERAIASGPPRGGETESAKTTDDENE